jgi:Raf kinase inhibitor-like YbhB/YbcL family protein
MLEKLPEAVGEMLQGQRAGLEKTVYHRLFTDAAPPQLEVRSSVFGTDQSIPARYTADGAGVSPPLEWRGIPAGTGSVVIVVEDADAPTPQPLVHAIVVNVDPRESSLIEGALDSPHHTGVDLQAGRNSFLSHAWLPPDPPPGHGVHRYVFQVFALRDASFSKTPGREEVVRAIECGALAAGYVIGTYDRAVRVRSVQPDASTQEDGLVLGADTALQP